MKYLNKIYSCLLWDLCYGDFGDKALWVPVAYGYFV